MSQATREVRAFLGFIAWIVATFLVIFLLAVAFLFGGCVNPRVLAPMPSFASAAPCLSVRSARGVVDGSAFVARWRGGTYLFTAWHVAERTCGNATVSANGVSELATFQRLGDLDLAFAQCSPPAAWRVYDCAESRPGIAVESHGLVFASDLPLRVEHRSFHGAFTGYFPLRNRAGRLLPGRYLYANCVAIPGMSGGPVLDEKGRVVAVLTNYDHDNHDLMVALDIPE